MDFKHAKSVSVALLTDILLLSKTKTIPIKIWATTIGFFSLSAISKGKKILELSVPGPKQNLQSEGFSLNCTAK
jgi:hypothetical protein